MSEKFAMKLVIDNVTSPLLYARLSAIALPRDRAALLRAIAEAACRGETIGTPTSRTLDAPARHWDESPAAHRPVIESSHHRATQPSVDDAFSVVDTSHDVGHDAGAIAEGLAAFL